MALVVHLKCEVFSGQPGCPLVSLYPNFFCQCLLHPSVYSHSGFSHRHFRYGAPPVINPLGTDFPANATVRPSYSISITLSSAVQNTTFVNVTTPAAGDWFIAAHLPEAAGRIEVKVRVLERVSAVVLCPVCLATADPSALSPPAGFLHSVPLYVPGRYVCAQTR